MSGERALGASLLRVGKVLPSAGRAYGIRDKLLRYSLNREHPDGRHKAERFRRVMGIDQDSVDRLLVIIASGVHHYPVSAIRERGPFGQLCEVRIPVGERFDGRTRPASLVTAWEIREPGAAPRLVTAYIDS
jgi:hypothetical protein